MFINVWNSHADSCTGSTTIPIFMIHNLTELHCALHTSLFPLFSPFSFLKLVLPTWALSLKKGGKVEFSLFSFPWWYCSSPFHVKHQWWAAVCKEPRKRPILGMAVLFFRVKRVFLENKSPKNRSQTLLKIRLAREENIERREYEPPCTEVCTFTDPLPRSNSLWQL